MADVKQITLNDVTYDIKDTTAREATQNALYYTSQSLTTSQKQQVYVNLGLGNIAELDYVVVT